MCSKCEDTGRIDCPLCGGTGESQSGIGSCSRCGGSGDVKCDCVPEPDYEIPEGRVRK